MFEGYWLEGWWDYRRLGEREELDEELDGADRDDSDRPEPPVCCDRDDSERLLDILVGCAAGERVLPLFVLPLKKLRVLLVVAGGGGVRDTNLPVAGSRGCGEVETTGELVVVDAGER